MKINEIITHKKLGEQATAGATSAGNIATLANPHVAAGPDRFKKSYTGSPGRSGTKAPTCSFSAAKRLSRNLRWQSNLFSHEDGSVVSLSHTQVETRI